MIPIDSTKTVILFFFILIISALLFLLFTGMITPGTERFFGLIK